MGIKLGRFCGPVLGLGMTVLVAGCGDLTSYHGFVPPAEEIASLEVGVTTKDEVVSLFGPPMAEQALQNNTVYYGSSEFRAFGPFAPEEVDRQILAVSFDASDRVRNVSRYTLSDGRIVVLDRRVTEDGINDVSFLGQLFGAFGRIDTATLLGDDG